VAVKVTSVLVNGLDPSEPEAVAVSVNVMD
jgi:hypothetical protein